MIRRPPPAEPTHRPRATAHPRAVARRGLFGPLALLPLLPLLLTSAAPAGSAQDPSGGFGPPAIPTKPQPQIEVPESEHSFGTVYQGTVVTHSFTVRNRGTATLRISKVHSNCGCTSSYHDEEIPPGGEGRVELRIDTADLSGGPQRKNATISSDDPAAPQVTLWMAGEIVPLLVPAVMSIRLNGICEEAKEGRFRFAPGTDRPTEVLAARLREGRAEVVSFDPLEGGGIEVHLRAGAGEEPAILRDELLLQVKLGDDEPIETRFPVIIEHSDRIRITPGGNVVFYRRQTAHLETDPARDVSKELHVRPARPDLPCRVASVRLEDVPEGLFRAEVREEVANQHYVITVRVLKTFEESQVRGRLVIETDDPVRPRREREVYAQFRLEADPR